MAELARAWIRKLDPGYFALVMATGIVSIAFATAGMTALSQAMLGVTVACYLLLVAAYGWRLGRYRAEFLADAADPRKAFGYFSFVAGSDVLGTRLAAGGYQALAAALLVLAGLAWALLCYVMTVRLVARHDRRPALADSNGTWFLWTVGTQSIAVSAASLAGKAAGPLNGVVVGFWAVGVVLYLLLATLVLAGLLQYPVEPAGLTPAYWVFMGATAISVLAGAKLLGLPPGPLVAAVRPVVAGLSVLLWAFGTWLIPLLIALGVWRHLLRRVPLRYEPGLWGMVFPLGMWSVASESLGSAIGVRWLETAGQAGTWVAFAVWAAVFAAMLGAFGGDVRGTAASGAAGPG